MIGDEAYYYYWGNHPAGGYYDLSPMIGWWEYLFTRVSYNLFWLRIPNLLAQLLVTFGMYEWLTRVLDRRKSILISSIYFFSPVPFLAMMISPDVPLVLFTFLSAFCFFYAFRESSFKRAALLFFGSGVLWGAAFLSKYFAFAVLPAFGLWWIYSLTSSDEQRTRTRGELAVGLFLWALGIAPFVFQHLYWNYLHCWATITFNFLTRQKAYDGPIYQTFGLFLVYLLVLSTPLFWKESVKRPQITGDVSDPRLREQIELRKFSFLMWLVPIALFGFTALVGRGQGLHWYMSFVPFFMIWVCLFLREDQLVGKLRKMLIAALGLGGVVTVLLFFPESLLGEYFMKRSPMDFQIAFHGTEWPALIEPFQKDSAVIFTDGYTFGSNLDTELSRYARKNHTRFAPVGMWGDGSRFGRVFDFTIDFRPLEGKQLTFVTKGKIPLHRWGVYFDRTEVNEMKLNGATFYITQAYGFKASVYIKEVFNEAVNRYYPKIWEEKCEIRY